MPKRDPRVTEYIQKSAPFARPILRQLREVIHKSDPRIEEDIKWGMPSFLYQQKIVCGIAGFKAHCAFWFWKGLRVVEKSFKEGMGHFGRLTSMKDLPPATKIKGYVKKALNLIDQQQARKGR
jgi:hypothetical protein